ncbi:hypothetical protein V1522DRAFT_396010 [Lipomyces starkeyi]
MKLPSNIHWTCSKGTTYYSRLCFLFNTAYCPGNGLPPSFTYFQGLTSAHWAGDRIRDYMLTRSLGSSFFFYIFFFFFFYTFPSELAIFVIPCPSKEYILLFYTQLLVLCNLQVCIVVTLTRVAEDVGIRCSRTIEHISQCGGQQALTCRPSSFANLRQNPNTSSGDLPYKTVSATRWPTER